MSGAKNRSTFLPACYYNDAAKVLFCDRPSQMFSRDKKVLNNWSMKRSIPLSLLPVGLLFSRNEIEGRFLRGKTFKSVSSLPSWSNVVKINVMAFSLLLSKEVSTTAAMKKEGRTDEVQSITTLLTRAELPGIFPPLVTQKLSSDSDKSTTLSSDLKWDTIVTKILYSSASF